MFFRRFYDENPAQASYMIACEKAREPIIVDPNLDVAQYTRAAGGGGRSSIATSFPQANGIAGVSNLAGGFESWVAEGFEVER